MRGLKYTTHHFHLYTTYVAPLAGAWIEMDLPQLLSKIACVAPLAGAWIEIKTSITKLLNLPVAPLAGAWIEIFDCTL